MAQSGVLDSPALLADEEAQSTIPPSWRLTRRFLPNTRSSAQGLRVDCPASRYL
jgi:hypothetical protein